MAHDLSPFLVSISVSCWHTRIESKKTNKTMKQKCRFNLCVVSSVEKKNPNELHAPCSGHCFDWNLYYGIYFFSWFGFSAFDVCPSLLFIYSHSDRDGYSDHQDLQEGCGYHPHSEHAVQLNSPVKWLDTQHNNTPLTLSFISHFTRLLLLSFYLVLSFLAQTQLYVPHIKSYNSLDLPKFHLHHSLPLKFSSCSFLFFYRWR